MCLFGFAAALSLNVQTASATAPAGAILRNQATATYFNTRFGLIETVTSNVVEVEVAPVEGLLVSGGRTLTLPRGGAGLYVFTMTNTGNVALDAAPELINLAGDDFDTTGTLFEDSDGDGVASTGDRSIAPGVGLRLAPGERRMLLYRFFAPESVAEDDRSRVELRVAALASTGVSLSGSAAAEAVIVSMALSVEKSASLRTGGGEIDYVLRVRNNAEAPVAPYSTIDGAAITLDGAPVSAVVVRDAIPLNTHIASSAPVGGFVPVYHRRGEPDHAYLSVLEGPREEIDAIAFLHEGAYDIGRASDLVFTARLVETVSEVDIENTAFGYAAHAGGTKTFPSNTVITPATGPGHSIKFRNEADSGDITHTPFGTNFKIRLGAARCNTSQAVDRVVVTVRTTFAGDKESVIAQETGANTGIFVTSNIAIFRVSPATQDNGVVEGDPGDAAGAIATAACLGENLEANLQVQPGGFVFDSVTNAPVPGARVLAFTRTPSAIAASLGARSLIPAAPLAGADADEAPVSDAITDSAGYYDLGAIPRGEYRILVTPPERYDYPSERENFNGFARRVDPVISYGVSFSFDGGPVSGVDIPLDPGLPIPVAISKSADRTQTRRGGYVIYTLSARNNMAQALTAASITDQLPAGFHLVEGSAKLAGAPLATPPVANQNGEVVFQVGDIAPVSAVELTYALRVGPAAGQGRAVNTAILRGAQAGVATVYASAPSTAVVRVDDSGGVFADEAVVAGRVFLDIDGDGAQHDSDEPGVPGVKIVTAEGYAVVTDALGRYSLFGLQPRTTAFALVGRTLPPGAAPTATDIDDADAPGSRLIDLKRGELRVENFALTSSPVAMADVARRFQERRGLKQSESLLRGDLPLTFENARRISSRSETARDTMTEIRRGTAPANAALAPEKGPETLKRVLAESGSEPGFLEPLDGAQAGSRAIRVRVKSSAGADLALSVNGVEAPESMIGAKAIDRTAGVQLYEYVAVRLKPGANTLTLAVRDPFGNARGGETITVYAPGDPAGLQIVAPASIPADAASRVPVILRVVDAEGRRVNAPAEVTLSARRGDWDVKDIRDSEPGLQALIDNGEATFDFIPPDLVGAEILSARADFGEAEATVRVTPDLSDRIVVGVVEGAVSFGEQGLRAVETLGPHDISPFEETTEGLRGALYLKGRIRGDALLTLRYDSDADTEERLFRDIRRDEYYPVYGDNSERGFDAQSSGGLYVKVERGGSYMLYGDIAIEPQVDAIQLGAYRRSLTGGRAHFEEGPVTLDLFIAETDQDQRVIEIAGRGVSGPYDVDFSGVVEGSEVVELIVRDRDQPNVILSTQLQERLNDYAIDFFSGALIFNRPVSRLDDALNPVSIRVTYETDDGAGDDYLVYGGEARVQIAPGVALGYREVRSDADETSDERRTVRSAYAEAGRDGWGRASVEFSQTIDREGRDGEGMRAGYAYRDDLTTVLVEGARTDADFDAPNSRVAAGRDELRVTVERRIDERSSLRGEALHTRDAASGDQRTGAEIKARSWLWDSLEFTAGGRFVRTHDARDDEDLYSAIAGVVWRPDFAPGVSLRAEAEQDVNDMDNHRLLLGGDYQMTPTTRFYALGELSTAESGTFGIGDGAETQFTTKAGAEYRLHPSVTAFTEYRETASAGLNGGVAQGVRGSWKITERVSLRSSLEHVEPVGAGDQRETSVTFGAQYSEEPAGLMLRGDLEADRDEAGMGWYANTAVAFAVHDDLTLLGRNRLAVDDRGAGRIRDRLRLGAAWRPESDKRVTALSLYEFELDDDETLREQSHRWSVAGSFDPEAGRRVTLKYAGENFAIDGPSFSDSSTLHLLRAGAEVDLARNRLALAGNAVLFTDDGGETLVTGIGAEVKAHVIKNLQLGVGYNHIDVEQERLRDLYHSGFFMRLRLKLDDDLWAAFDALGLTGE